MEKIKVRFAPSPTGPLHIGGARSALFNYLFAANKQGELVLRIEDTDLDRSKREYEDEIHESLRWLGIEWQEGADIGGANGPYRQTERLDIYEGYTKQLLDSGNAYYCFCSEDELEAERNSLSEKGETPRYLGKCRNLTEEERAQREKEGKRPTVRFRVPENQTILIDDLVRGQVSFETENMGDFIIIKSDGIPTYNFAVVIDDVLMGITHVIRAEEHLSNTPRQLMLYEALGFDKPFFAHISLILGEDRQKMSKRHGATSLFQYRDLGYLPEAMFNFLALLGWAPEGENQIMTKADLGKAFSLERVSKSPAVFDLDKLNWLNQQYLLSKSLLDYKQLLVDFVSKSNYAADINKLNEQQFNNLAKSLQPRLVFLGELDSHLQILFEPCQISEEAFNVLKDDGVIEVLCHIKNNLPEDLEVSILEVFLKSTVKELKIKAKQLYMPLRCALSGQLHGMELPVMINIWGRDETLRRLTSALTAIQA